ncbi:MAG: hypothetical protein WBA24_19750 [Geitlerinemataceae cyanobacterium]
MPASSKHYQSRLFNLILQQSIRWTDRAAETFRNVKIATVWGIQAILYPVYVVVQATRNSLDRSATSPTQELASADEISIPSADAPLEIVLADIKRGELDIILDEIFPEFADETLDSHQLPHKLPQLTAIAQWVKSGVSRMGAIVREGYNPSASISVSQPKKLAKNRIHKLPIRGIASLIADRKLVLVNDGNQILNILNSRQQQLLERRIFIEIGNYWMTRQSVREELPAERKPNRLLGWMQTSPVAISLNLFQEATLASRQTKTHSTPTRTLPLPSFSSESSAVVPPSSSIPSVNPVQQASLDRWNSIARSTQTSLTQTQLFLVEKARGVRFPKISDPWQTSSDISPEFRSSTISSAKTAPKALPTAPENPSFYYHNIGKIVKSVSDSFEKNVALVSDRFARIADPWLSPLDFSETTDRTNSIDENLRSKVQFRLGDRARKQLPASQSLEQSIGQLQTWAKDSRNWLAEWGIPGLEPIREVAIESASFVPETPKNRPENNLSPSKIEAIEVLPNPFVWESQITTLPKVSQSDWIETEATSVEYIKHPLEKVLGWLDRIAFWLEERIVQLWQGIQRFWQSSLGFHK